MSDDLRTRIAQILYGDGDDLAWSRAIQLADLVMWGIGLTDNTATANYCTRCGIPHTDDCLRGDA